MKRTAIVTASALLAAGAFAVDYIWTGKGDDSAWTNSSNWAEGAIPQSGAGNHVVFNVSGSLYIDGISSSLPCEISVNSGDVVFGDFKSSYSDNGTYDATPLVFNIGENASLVFSNRLERGRRAMNVTKTGKGVLKLRGACGVDSSYPPLGLFDVKEGDVEFNTENANWLFYCTNLVVRSGAVFNCRKNNGIRHKNSDTYPCLVSVEEGGVLKLLGGGTGMSVSALEGKGEIKFSTTGSTTVKLTPHASLGSCVFGGCFLPTGKAKVEVVTGSTGVQTIGGLASFSDIYHIKTDGHNLAFASGLEGEFKLKSLTVRSGTRLKLEDTEGNPITANVSGSSSVQTEGSGSIKFSKDYTVVGDAMQHTGSVILADTVTLGDGSDSANDADLSTIDSISSSSSSSSYGIVFNNAGEVDVSVPNVSLPSLTFATKNPVTVSGGTIGGDPSVCSFNAGTSLKTPTATKMVDAECVATVRQTGGEVYLGGTMPGRYELLGGKLSIVSSIAPSSASAIPNLFLNGGTLAFNKRNVQYGLAPFAATDGSDVRVTVGENGVVLTDEEMFNSTGTISLTVPFASAAQEGRLDGGVTQKTRLATLLSKPMSITGPYRLMDGHLGVMEDCDLENVPAALGVGDTVIGNATLYFGHMNYKTRTDKSRTLNLGSKLVASGASLLYYTPNSSDAAQHMTAGSLGRTRGGVLFLADANTSSFNGTAAVSSLNITGTIPSNRSCGISCVPMIVTGAGINSDNYRSSGSSLDFVCFTEDGYVKRFDGYASDFSRGLDSAVCIDSKKVLNASDNLSAGALLVRRCEVRIPEGARVFIGDGVNPGMLLLETPSLYGSGTVDFGNGEGVVAINSLGETSYMSIPYAIEGENGISFVATPWSAYHRIYLNGPAKWKGDTVINSTWLDARENTSLGDKVVVGAGKRCGGVLVFSKPIVFETDVEASGWGIQMGTYDSIHSSGAIVFEADAEASGDVKLIDETRVLVSGTETRGKISGVVSGDRLSVYRGEGTLVLSGENTYTGGTLVRGSTLALGCAGSAGTGSITLDNGTLAFENGEAVTFMNDISGVGTIALTGTAPVLFRCDMSALSASLDLCGTWQTFTEMPPFSKIVNSHSGKATFALASNLGTVSWPGYALEGKVSLAIGEGTVLDLGGREIEVFRLEPGAASKIVNGTVKQIKPMVGMRVIFR